MNKFTVGILGGLGGIALVAGSVVALDNIPATKGKLNVSVGDKVIVGETTNNKVETDNSNLLESELEKQGFVAVTYVTEDETKLLFQKKGSIPDIMEVPTKQGYVFMGWSEEENGEITFSVNKNTTLYPVYMANNNQYFMMNTFNDSTLYFMASNYFPGSNVSRFTNSATGKTLTGYIVGFAEESNSIVPLKDITSAGKYAIYYSPETEKVYSCDEMAVQRTILDLGEKAMQEVTLHTADETVTAKIYEVNSYIGQSKTINNTEFTIYGFSTSATSTATVYSTSQFVEGTEYYAVYKDTANNLVSYETAKNGWDVEIMYYNSTGYLKNADVITYTDTVTIDNIRFILSGYATAYDSPSAFTPEDLTEERLESLSITNFFACYTRADTGEEYTVSQLKSLTAVASRCYYYVTAGSGLVSSPKILDAYMQDVTINDVTYTFHGWATASGSTETTETYTASSSIYAVYAGADGTLYSIEDLKAL